VLQNSGYIIHVEAQTFSKVKLSHREILLYYLTWPSGVLNFTSTNNDFTKLNKNNSHFSIIHSLNNLLNIKFDIPKVQMYGF